VKTSTEDHPKPEAKVEFIKLNEKEMIIRTRRNGTVIDRIAQVVPPEDNKKKA
jgi:hypothetical protein